MLVENNGYWALFIWFLYKLNEMFWVHMCFLIVETIVVLYMICLSIYLYLSGTSYMRPSHCETSSYKRFVSKNIKINSENWIFTYTWREYFLKTFRLTQIKSFHSETNTIK